MTYAVSWKLDAILELNRIEAAAADPKVVREASARMDFALRRYPKDMGESRDVGFRIWYEDVLGVYYRIDDAAMQVEVIYVGPTRRR